MPNWVDDIAAAVDHLGPEPVGIIWGIGQTNWESAEQRDAFLKIVSSTMPSSQQT